MKTMQEIERRLMAELTIESLVGRRVDVENMPEYSEDANSRMKQEQYAYWCVAVKGLLLTDHVEPDLMRGRYAATMKRYISEYAGWESSRKNQAMRYLYDNTDKSLLVHQISMLVKYSLYKDVEDINDISDEMRRQSLDPESVSICIAFYVIFTILVNDNVDVKQFNDLFVRVWFDYYENWAVREIMFKMRGNGIKQDFAGVLIN